jgi:hypothetical protein
MRKSVGRVIPIDHNGFFCAANLNTCNTAPVLVSPERPIAYHPAPGSNSNAGDYDDLPLQQPVSLSNKSVKEEEGWVRNFILGTEKEPCIATQKGLILALKHQAPIHVIRFLLTINPNIVNIPKKGPTPLQVAVQYNASLEVIQALLEASPFGLCVTNHDSPEDPLSYAKRNHIDRPGLIELLSRPLSYWVTERRYQNQRQKDKEVPYPLQRPPKSPSSSSRKSLSKKKVLSEMAPNNSKKTTFSTPVVAANTQKSTTNKIDREEINNVKTLCVQLYKANRKMAKEVVACKGDIESHSKLLATMSSKDQILEELKEEQRSQFFRQLIALDMKERAYKARLNKMERRYVRQLENRLDDWTGETRDQALELQLLIDSEAKVNAEFRNDLSEWMERREDQENRCVPSYVFATNLGDLDEKSPLCGGDFRDDVNTVDDVVEIATDETTPCTNSLNCVKKRPWRPLFKHWDRIMLVDGE